MKKTSTAVKPSKKNLHGRLTIGLDLGDRWSWYCVLDQAGEVIGEQRVGTTPKAMREAFAAMPCSRVALETGMHSPWVSRPAWLQIPLVLLLAVGASLAWFNNRVGRPSRCWLRHTARHLFSIQKLKNLIR